VKRRLENARKIAAIQLDHYESRDRSVYDILHDINFLAIAETCTRDDYLTVLKSEPRLATLWYLETADRRSSDNPFYIVEVEKGDYRVHFHANNENFDRFYLSFSDKLEACAYYLELEIQHLFRSYHSYLENKKSPKQRSKD
jgi:hypothetical protein